MNMFEKFREAGWLLKINKRDKDAFGQCYDFYAPKLYRHAYYRLGSKELAEDIVSDIFARTWEYLCDPANKIDNLKAFLYRIANNLVVDCYRSRGRQPVLFDDILEATLGDGGKGTEKIGERIEFDNILKGLEKLDEGAREVLIWRYIDELEIGEIAKLSGKSKNAVYVALHRALRRAQKLIKENNYENL